MVLGYRSDWEMYGLASADADNLLGFERPEDRWPLALSTHLFHLVGRQVRLRLWTDSLRPLVEVEGELSMAGEAMRVEGWPYEASAASTAFPPTCESS